MTRFVATSLTVRIGDRQVLTDVGLTVGQGEFVGLLGPNASGKTTLLRVLAGLVEPAEGAIELDGMAVGKFSRQERARRIAYLEQGAKSEWPLAVERVVALGRLPYLGSWSVSTVRDAELITDAMTQCDVLDLAGRPATALSGGEQARVMLARALAGTPEVLLADEPVSHLDPFHQLQIMEVIQSRARQGAAVLVVLHDLTLAARFCDRLVMIRDGRVAAEGPPRDVLTDDTLARVFSVNAAFLHQGDGFFVVPDRRIDSTPDVAS
jgi:iron complex transport system ATP-binding protein